VNNLSGNDHLAKLFTSAVVEVPSTEEQDVANSGTEMTVPSKQI
jgi:hypothetical protein